MTDFALQNKLHVKCKTVQENGVWNKCVIYVNIQQFDAHVHAVGYSEHFFLLKKVKRLVRVNATLINSIRHCCLFWLRNLFWRSIQCLVIRKNTQNKPQRNIDNFISEAFKHFTVQLHKSVQQMESKIEGVSWGQWCVNPSMCKRSSAGLVCYYGQKLCVSSIWGYVKER